MFKKLKDKIAEEVKQSPLRLPASVQQHLSQYSAFTRDANSTEDVLQISDLKNGRSSQQTLVDIAEDSAENTPNHFSIGEEDSRSASPGASKEENFQAVNLNEPKRDLSTSTPQPGGRLSRQSSLNSVFSDVSFLPGSADSTYQPYHFQSDLESNVSEFDESASQSGQYAADRISKEHIFNAYQKMRTRYHKYKGRYADLARHYRELEREREKVKHVLTETQDRSLRRISELREQCTLEQQAKAHLEENLRSDLEEKDNLIAVLRTKVKLLASGSLTSVSEGILVDLTGSETSTKVTDDTGSDTVDDHSTDNSHTANEVQLLKDKLQRFESLLIKCKENIKTQKDRIGQMQAENDTLKLNETRKHEEMDLLQKAHREQLSQLTDSLNMARREIETLRQQEQEAALAAAENKQQVHEELQKQEGEMIRLRAEREQLHHKSAQMEAELKSVRDETAKQLQDAETVLELEKQKLLKELSRGKTEALKLMDEDMDQRLEDLKKEKDAHWESVLRKRLSEEKESHARAVRQVEEQYRARLAELQEEKTLALEEKELYCTSLITREQKNQQAIQDELAKVKLELEAKEKLVERVREDAVDERRSWVQQIEENRQRHLEGIQSLTAQQQDAIDQLEIKHRHAIDTAILELKEVHRKELDKIQQQHEELLQAANEDMESSAKNQIEQLRGLLKDKEAELSQRVNQLSEEIKLKDSNIAEIREQVSALDSVKQQLEQALEQVKLLDSLNDELEKSKDANLSLTSRIQLLEEELSNSNETNDHLRKELIESKESLAQQHKLMEEMKATVSEKEKASSELNGTLIDKEKCIADLRKDLEQLAAKESEREQNNSSLTAQLEKIKITLNAKTEKILQLEESRNAMESQLRSINEEKEQLLAGKGEELKENLQRIANLEGERTQNEQLSRQFAEQKAQLESHLQASEEKSLHISKLKQELEDSLESSRAELSSLQAALATKEERVAELEKAENLRNSGYSELEKLLAAKQLELDAMQKDAQQKEEEIVNLKRELEHFNIKESGLEEKLLDLIVALKGKQEELEVANGLSIQKDNRISQLEHVENLLNTEKSQLITAVQEKENQLGAKLLEFESLQDSLRAQEQRVAQLQHEVDQAKHLTETNSLEWNEKTSVITGQLETARLELEESRSNLKLKESKLEELELRSAEESDLNVIIHEKQLLLVEKESELKSLQQSIAEWEERNREFTQTLENTKLQLEELQTLAATKEERIVQLEHAQFEAESLVAEKDKLLLIKETEFQNSLMRISELEEKADNSKTTSEELNHLVKSTQSKLKTLEEALTKKNKQIKLLKERNVEEKNQLLVAKNQELEGFKQAHSEIQRTADEAITQLDSVKEELELARAATKESETRLNDVQNGQSQAMHELSELRQSSMEKENALQTELSKLEQQLSAKTVNFEKLLVEKESELQSLQQTVAEWEEKNLKLNQTMENIKPQLEELRTVAAEKEELTDQLGQAQVACQSLVTEKEKLEEALTKKNKQIKLLKERNVEEKNQLLAAKNQELEGSKQAHSEIQRTADEAIKQLDSVKEELEFAKSAIKDREACLNDVQKAQSQTMHELSEFRQSSVEKENAMSSDLAKLEQQLSAKTAEFEKLNQSLAAKESSVTEMKQIVEEQSQQLALHKYSLSEKEMEIDQYKIQLSTGECQWQQTLAKLHQQLSSKEEELQRTGRNLEEIQLQLVAKEASADSIKAEKEAAVGRTAELEKEVQTALKQLSEKQIEKEIIETECGKLKEELSVRSQTADSEQMQNQIKALTDEVSSLNEEKNRLEVLCKRFKVQLADTRKMLSTKSAETTKVDVVEPEVKSNNVSSLQSRPREQESQREQLQQQLFVLQQELDATRHQHKMEVAELRRLIEMGKAPATGQNANSSLHGGALEEATEFEYLRNILFEYMMGRQSSTLVKVVAAILRFTPEQTRKISEREEQRQSLLGHLGFA